LNPASPRPALRPPHPDLLPACGEKEKGRVARTKDAMNKHAAEKQTPEDYAARFGAEKAALRRHYCNVFKFWRLCPLRACRKARSCGGDAEVCLKRRVREIPRELQWQARRQILAVTPADAGAAVRTAREFLPGGLV
jgi:hypothetical protein